MSSATNTESLPVGVLPDASEPRRADLQGLRAVAVLAVIAYHFGIPGASGGFVGVDIFFVLSGFLITRLLMREIDTHGRIRLLTFWANRVKRLLPNGLLVVLSTVLASLLLLPAYRLPGISGDALSAAAFFANFRFAARTVDYFHLDDPPSPLLHYWSLAVEEQFYVALPLLVTATILLVRARLRTSVLVLLGTIVIGSLAAALLTVEHNQPKAFFHPEYRAWQLALGGMTGLVFERRLLLPPRFRAALSVLGAIAIALSITLLHDGLQYPGIWGLAPTAGTAALIYGLDAPHRSRTAFRILTLPPVVAIGDMSYSLYLWHWPVVVFLQALLPEFGAAAILLALLLTALLASAAYFLVERPIHRLRLPALDPGRIVAAGAAATSFVVAAAFGANALSGRSNPNITRLIAEADADLGPNYANGCHRDFKDVDQSDCRFGRIGGPRVVLFGDSHAAQWFTALARAATDSGWELNAWTKTSCPSVDVTIWHAPGRAVYRACDEWRDQRLRELLERPPALVIVTNSSRYQGWIFDRTEDRLADRTSTATLWQQGSQRTIETLLSRGIPVVELQDTPRMYRGYRDCLSSGRWADCGRPRTDALDGLATLQSNSALHSRLDLSDFLCTPQTCFAVLDGKIAYRDSHHLRASHAASLHRPFAELLQRHRNPR